MKKWFEWMIQWLTHKYFTCFITGWISVFERISWMNDSMTNTFLTGTCCHLVAKLCYRHKRYLKHQLLLKDDYHRHQCLHLNYKLSSQYFCHNMNDCKTEIILCSWKEAAKHGNCLLSVSAAARTQMWMFWYDFFKGVTDRRIVII